MTQTDTTSPASDTDLPAEQSSAEQPNAEQPKLTDEDLRRVQQYLSSPIHQVERKPFRPWLMMAGLIGTVLLLSLLSWLISYFVLG